MAKRQRRRAGQRREPLARRRFRPAARSCRNTDSLTVLTSTRPHDGSACLAGLRTCPVGLVSAPASSRTLRDGAGSRSSRPTLTTPGGSWRCRHLDSRAREIAGLNRNGQLVTVYASCGCPVLQQRVVMPAWLRDSGRLDLCVPRTSSTALTSRVCSSCRPAVMIIGHVPAVHVSPDHAASRVAAARPAGGDMEDRRELDPASPARRPAAAATAPEAELGGPGTPGDPARRDTGSPPTRAAATGHPGHDPPMAPRHRPPPLGRKVQTRQDRQASHPPETAAGATAGSTANWPGWGWESRRRRYGRS